MPRRTGEGSTPSLYADFSPAIRLLRAKRPSTPLTLACGIAATRNVAPNVVSTTSLSDYPMDQPLERSTTSRKSQVQAASTLKDSPLDLDRLPSLRYRWLGVSFASELLSHRSVCFAGGVSRYTWLRS